MRRFPRKNETVSVSMTKAARSVVNHQQRIGPVTAQRLTAALLAASLTYLATAELAHSQTVEQHTQGPKKKITTITGGLPPPPPTPPATPAGH